MSKKVTSTIFPVPTYMVEDNTIYKVYVTLLKFADINGQIRLSNEEISNMIGVSEHSSVVTTSVNKLKSMGVVERLKKSSRTDMIGLKRILQLKSPYDKLAFVFQREGSIQAKDFLKEMRNL